MIILPDFPSVRLLVVGDVMLDSYWHGSTSRISPEAPVPVVHVKQEETRVGGAGNVALNVAALGAKATLLGLSGPDVAADQIEGMLADRDITCFLQRVQGSKTITKLRILSRHQQLIRADFEESFANWDGDAFQAVYESQLPLMDAVILSDYAKGALNRSEDLIKAAIRAGKPVIVDPKGTDFERYRGATLITPNLSEFEAVVGHCENQAEIERRGVDLRESLGLVAILITRSEKGMTLLARGHEPLHLSTQAREVFDVTGAGDTVVATLGAALAADMPMHEAVTLSNIAAGIVVTKLGTATVGANELQLALRGKFDSNSRGVFGEDELKAKIADARAKGERIVMTNGCFDILHLGHIDYLEKARELGGRLIVAVNDDASVVRLKGMGRPVNTLATRMRMLSALASVDWVVPFTEDTPERLICKLLPDVLVKGGDYTQDQIAGGACVKASGGDVIVLDFLQGHSTTELINKIRN